MSAPTPRTGSLRGMVLFGFLYFLLGWIGLLLAEVPENVPAGTAAFWIPSGIALIVLLRFGPRWWPGIALGVAGLGVFVGMPALAVGFAAAGQVGEGLLGYRLLRPAMRPSRGAHSALASEVLQRIAITALVAPLVGASLRGFGLWLPLVVGGVGSDVGFLTWLIGGPFLSWYLGDAVAIGILVPLVLLWRGPRAVDAAKDTETEPASPWRDRLETFGELVGSAISQSPDLDDGLRLCAKAMVEHLDAGLGRIWIHEVDQECLILRATAGIEHPLLEDLVRIPIGEAGVGKVAFDRRAYFTNDIPNDPFLRHREWCRDEGLTAFVGLPLLVENRLVGVMAMFMRSPIEVGFVESLRPVVDAIAVGIERKRVERDLERNHIFFQAVTEQAGEGITIVDREGRYLLVNPAFCRMLGYSREELLERTVFDLVPPETKLRPFRLAIEGQCNRRVTELIRKDGSLLTAEVTSSPLDIGDERLALGLIRDVTREEEAKEKQSAMQEQLRLSQRMESVGQLAGGVAHDFNNLLLVILGHTELASDRLDEAHPKVLESLNEIRVAGERAAVLTRQLLAFSRRQPMEMGVLELNQIISSLMKILRRVIPESIEIQLIEGEDLGKIEADAGQLEQVLMNLVLNARDAMEDSGRAGQLTIRTENVTVQGDLRETHPWAVPGPYVLLTVIDDGAGMSAEILARIFDPFFTTRQLGSGTGLGLSTVYGIVKQHQGMILCDSEPGVGTTFRLYFPIVSPARERETGIQLKTTAPRGTETVLVAEDDEHVRSMVTSILRQAGYQVLEAADGAEALTLFVENQNEIALVVLDAVMPKLNGPETYARITGLCPNIRVLFTTGYSPTALPPGFQAGSDPRLLYKPYGPDELLRKVRQVIEA